MCVCVRVYVCVNVYMCVCICVHECVCWGSRACECEGLTNTRGQAWPAWERQDAGTDWNTQKEISGTCDEQRVGMRGKREVGSTVERPAISWMTQQALHCSLVSFLCLPW